MSPDYEAAKKLGITKNTRWEDGTEHHPLSNRLVRFMADHDFYDHDDRLCLKVGGDGDNGEHLMFLADAFFEYLDHQHKLNSIT